MDILSKENLLEIYESDKELFEKATHHNTTIAASTTPININDCRFRLTLFMRGGENGESSLEWATLVAVSKQSEPYEDMDTAMIHQEWLKSIGLVPTRTESYGNVYELGDIIISAEHDPRSGSDNIIISYI